MESQEKNEKKEMVKSWLNKQMKVKVTDNRIFIGKFICLDHFKNIILEGTKQLTKIEDSDGNLNSF